MAPLTRAARLYGSLGLAAYTNSHLQLCFLTRIRTSQRIAQIHCHLEQDGPSRYENSEPWYLPHLFQGASAFKTASRDANPLLRLDFGAVSPIGARVHGNEARSYYQGHTSWGSITRTAC